VADQETHELAPENHCKYRLVECSTQAVDNNNRQQVVHTAVAHCMDEIDVLKIKFIIRQT
jgi:hypothetical protein